MLDDDDVAHSRRKGSQGEENWVRSGERGRAGLLICEFKSTLILHCSFFFFLMFCFVRRKILRANAVVFNNKLFWSTPLFTHYMFLLQE